MKKLGILIAITTVLMACAKEPIHKPTPTDNPPIGTGNPNTGNSNTGNPGTKAARIKLRAEMIISGIAYDSIRGSLMIRSWDSTGQLFTTFYSMTPGTNRLELPNSRVRFNFRLSKWGATDELEILTKDIKADSVYVLGAEQEAKTLKTEIVYMLVNGEYKPESKKEFSYHLNGWLDKVTHYGKGPDGRPAVSMTSRFAYNGANLDRITRLDANNNESGYTAFQYNGAGKISAMNYMTGTNGSDQILATVEYSNINREEVAVSYTYSGRDYNPKYYMQMEGGNLVSAVYAVPSQHNEMVNYRYDLNINPYYHLNWPDLYFSNSSKNNVTVRVQMASGDTAGIIPYDYSYSYDNEGYPKEVITKYKSDLTDQHAYTTKTVLTYN